MGEAFEKATLHETAHAFTIHQMPNGPRVMTRGRAGRGASRRTSYSGGKHGETEPRRAKGNQRLLDLMRMAHDARQREEFLDPVEPNRAAVDQPESRIDERRKLEIQQRLNDVVESMV